MREFIGKNAITFPVGPFLSNSDGITPVTGLSVGSCDIAGIQKYGGTAAVDIAANSWAVVASMGGHYNLTLTSSQADTLGPLRITIVKSGTCLPYFEDILLVNSEYFNAKYGAIPFATLAAVNSLDVRVQALPNSQTLAAGFAPLPNSQTLNAHIIALPTSQTLNALGVTLPTSAMVALIPNSAAVAGMINTLPTSATLQGRIATLPNSQTLNAHVITLPTSSVLNAHIITLPNSSVLRAQILTLPTSASLRGEIAPLPNSAGLAGVSVQITSLDVRVTSLALGGGPDVSSIAFKVWDFSSRTLTSAGAGGATASEVQSACYLSLTAGWLMSSESITARIATLPSSAAWGLGIASLDAMVFSLGIQVSSITGGAGLTASEVQSACYGAMAGGYLMSSETLSGRFAPLPNSQTLNAHIITLPTSTSLRAEIATIPNSATARAWVLTFQNSQALAAGFATLMNSSALSTILVPLPNSQAVAGMIGTLPSSTTWGARISSLDARISSLDARVSSVQATANTIPTSQTLKAGFDTLPTSQALNALGLTLAGSSELRTLALAVGSLDTRVASVDIRVQTLPSSAAMKDYFDTLPSSAGLDSRVGSLNNLSLSDVTSGVFGFELETGLTFLQKERLSKAYEYGVASGGGTNTLVFRDHTDAKARITMTVDSYGNRSVVLDGD